MGARGEPPRPAGDNVPNAPPGRTSASKFPRSLRLACAGFALLFGFVVAVWATGFSPFRSAGAKPPKPLIEKIAAERSPLIEPTFGTIRLGAFAGEAAEMTGLRSSSTFVLAEPENYRRYRAAIRTIYGLDLEDMNYFGLGLPDSAARLAKLRDWVREAGEYGDVTIALEPIGGGRYALFTDSPEMRTLREIFTEAKAHGTTVWIRFASESNLRLSEYSAFGTREMSMAFYDAAVWFRSYMDGSVKLVFSPLINTAVIDNQKQFDTMHLTLLGEKPASDAPWDRIGGTLYRTTAPLEPTFETYYVMIDKWLPGLDWQLCELGGPYSTREEMTLFIQNLAAGRWPQVRKVNLFAREINTRADPEGQFGFVAPDIRRNSILQGKVTGKSWLAPVIAPSAALK